MLRAIVGRPAMLTDYAELLGRPVEWQESVLEFCANAGLPVRDADPRVASLVIDSRSHAVGELTPTQQMVAEAVRDVRGRHDFVRVAGASTRGRGDSGHDRLDQASGLGLASA